ncbi:cation:proton antiporter [Archaeoglobus profundus]|uniref:Sodium/hydrogen exchanger n=1 Tax=Archaeoglobus profundus (strain DSM 5631 / JCM 9629 / NBRC 100127 / Av18) TaxID=572546 RepID=D2RHP0_ARCPA|nr:cation:proton antiporter [Archaeoglobus profundus]ADB57815.1 sodium/hydrogen exchanger [Archaeoglobus profundus DSM 5631]
MEEFEVIILCTAIAYLCRSLRFSPIPMYILLGLVLKNLGIIRGDHSVLSELGIVFLLFYIGLKINPHQVSRNLKGITYAGLIDFVFNFFPPLMILLASGFDIFVSIVVSSAIYVSSSAICLKLLVDTRKLIFPFAETVVWLMVFEDLVMIGFLMFMSLSGISPLVKTILFLAIVYIIYKYSRMFRSLFDRSDEIPMLATFSIPSLAVLVKNLGISEALASISLGIAFSRYKLDNLVIPFKEVFLAIFFVMFGASINLEMLDIGVVLPLIFIAIVGKLLSGYFIGLNVHKSKKDGVRIFKYTVPRGEFSVILTTLFAPQFSGIISAVVLATSIFGIALSRKD